MPPLLDLAPAWLWTLMCIGLATFYALKWPRDKLGPVRRGFRYVVLRWFHALVWAMLGAAVWLHASGEASLALPARVLAIAALFIYVVFALVLLLPRSSLG